MIASLQDEQKKYTSEIQKITDDYIGNIDNIVSLKKTEILKV